MAVVDGIKMGLRILMSIAKVFITVYGILLVGLIFLGVIANIALSGDINVTDSANTTMSNLETSIINTVDNITSPLGVIASLIIIAVLVVMFPNFSFGGSGKKAKGGVL